MMQTQYVNIMYLYAPADPMHTVLVKSSKQSGCAARQSARQLTCYICCWTACKMHACCACAGGTIAQHAATRAL